jgi:hypothetical protein
VSEPEAKPAEIPEGVPAPTGPEIVADKPPPLPEKDPIAARAEKRAKTKDAKDRKIIIEEAMRKWAELPEDANARDREAIERIWRIVGRPGVNGQLEGFIPELNRSRQTLSIRLAMAGKKAAESEQVIAQMEDVCRQIDKALDEYSALVSSLSAGLRTRWEQGQAHAKMIAMIQTIPDLPPEIEA